MPRLKWNRSASKNKERIVTVGMLVGPVCAAAVVLSIPVALTLGVPRLHARVSRTISAEPARVVIEWPVVPPPAGAVAGPATTWLSPDIRAGLQSLAESALQAEADPLGPGALAALADTLGRTGWFERLDRVRREPGRVVRVSGQWRIPAAVVRHNGLDHLIARGGELLPPTYLPGQSGQRVIFGSSSAPPVVDGQPACGHTWGAPTPGTLSDVQAGVQLLGVLAGKTWRDQVAGVDVSAYVTQRRLVIVTNAGGRVVWGAAPSERPFGEANLEYKLWRLDEMNRRRGRIDAGFALADVSGVIATVDESAAALGAGAP